jgi:hypothetical protein
VTAVACVAVGSGSIYTFDDIGGPEFGSVDSGCREFSVQLRSVLTCGEAYHIVNQRILPVFLITAAKHLKEETQRSGFSA